MSKGAPHALQMSSPYVTMYVKRGQSGMFSFIKRILQLLFCTSKSKILRIKESRAYRDGIKKKGDKIGMVSVVSS